jgi:hypothetical protein
LPVEWVPATGVLLVLTALVSVVPVLPVAVIAGSIALTFMLLFRGLLFAEFTHLSGR